MNHVFKSFPLAFKMIFKDPINLLLALFPTVIALFLYFFTISTIYRNSDRFITMFRGYVYTSDQADLFAKILTVVLIIFLFLLMSWTFVIIVGIIAAPFNSMLSSRIEKKLLFKIEDFNKKAALQKIGQGLGQTFKNELKKLIFIIMIGAVAFLLNLIPLLYPVGIFLVAVLFSVQFVDYSWSRHDMNFGACLKDVLINIIPYSLSGFFFLLLVTVPIINAFVPALATSYYTVLWHYRQASLAKH